MSDTECTQRQAEEQEPAAQGVKAAEAVQLDAPLAGTDAPAPAQPAAAPVDGEAGPVDLRTEIARLEADKRDLTDRMLRIAADFENYRKRVRREMEEAGLRGMEGLLKELLPVLDNLDRALEAASTVPQAGSQTAALVEGVRLVQKQFLGVLEKFQVKTFDALGKPFDPNVHEAVQQVDSDSLPPGTVAAVFQRGYTAGQRLLRPALVAVVRARPEAAPTQAKSEQGEEASPS
ncbi:MAG: nucleotide exchange factor GrpE [Myxococcales bacterium]|nr:nucleotide exchange factor GrpE [Myxococcales bacterium]